MDQSFYHEVLRALLVMVSLVGVVCGIGFIVLFRKVKFLKNLLLDLATDRELVRNYETIKIKVIGIETKMLEKESLYLDAVNSIRREISDITVTPVEIKSKKKVLDDHKPIPTKSSVDPVRETLNKYLWEVSKDKPVKKTKKVSRKK